MVTMEVIRQLLISRSNNQWKRQQRRLVIPAVLCFVASIPTMRLVEFVSGFNYQQRFDPPITRPTRSCLSTAASIWSTGTKPPRRAFVTFHRTRLQQRRLQMQHLENTANLTSTESASTTPNATTLLNTKIYDLGVGKNPPLSINNTSTTTISNLSSSATNIEYLSRNIFAEVDQQINESGEDFSPDTNTSTTLNARLIGMNWMAPESVVKPLNVARNTVPTTNINSEVQKRQYRQEKTNAEKKSRRMVAYVSHAMPASKHRFCGLFY